MAREGSVLDQLTKSSGTVLRSPRVRDLKDLGPQSKPRDWDAEDGALLDKFAGRTTVIDKTFHGGEAAVQKTSDTRSTTYAPVQMEDKVNFNIPVNAMRPSENVDYPDNTEAEAGWLETEQAWVDVIGTTRKYEKRYGQNRNDWPKNVRETVRTMNSRVNDLIKKHNIREHEMMDVIYEKYPKTMMREDIFRDEQSIRDIRKDWPSKGTMIDGWHKDDMILETAPMKRAKPGYADGNEDEED